MKVERPKNQHILTGRIAVSVGVVGVIIALVSGVMFTIQIVNPGCGSVDSGFPIPWILTPQGCPSGWSTGTVYAWPFLALDALFYMGVGYTPIIFYMKRRRGTLAKDTDGKADPLPASL
jgi:hypothetical protein